MARKGGKGSSIINVPPPGKKFSHYRVDLDAVATPGLKYKVGEYLFVNIPNTMLPWWGKVVAVDPDGGLDTVTQVQPGIVQTAPIVATYAAKAAKGRLGTLTFSFTHIIP